MLDTHSVQTKSGILDSCDLCAPFMHAINDMLYMWTKLNHTNLFMNASSFLLKKIISVVMSKKKKNWFWFFLKKKTDLFLLCKKKDVFLERKFRSVFLMRKFSFIETQKN